MSESTAFLLYVLIPGATSLIVYWYFYTAFIEHLRANHPATYVSLGMPTELDSNLAERNRKLWAFLLALRFRSLGDRRLNFLGIGLIFTSFLAIGIGLFCVAAWNATH